MDEQSIPVKNAASNISTNHGQRNVKNIAKLIMIVPWNIPSTHLRPQEKRYDLNPKIRRRGRDSNPCVQRTKAFKASAVTAWLPRQYIQIVTMVR